MVYRKIMLKDAAIPNRPTNATAICAPPVENPLTRHPKPATVSRNISVCFLPTFSTETWAKAYETISTRAERILLR